jgi:hypothetical protein
MADAFIDKIALIYIKNRQILMALSKGKDAYYIPGGKDNSYRGICHKIAGVKTRGRNQALAAGKKTCLGKFIKLDLSVRRCFEGGELCYLPCYITK